MEGLSVSPAVQSVNSKSAADILSGDRRPCEGPAFYIPAVLPTPTSSWSPGLRRSCAGAESAERGSLMALRV